MRIEEKLADIANVDGGAVRLEAAETAFDPVDPSWIVFTAGTADDVIVSYLAQDDSPSDYWSSGDGLGEFQSFRSEQDRDARIAEIEADGRVALIVDKYDHSGVHYSVANTANYPDRRWDVAPSGVFVPCDDVQEKYANALRAADALDSKASTTTARDAAMADMVKDSNAILDEFSNWANGSVYATVQETWKVSEDGRMEMTGQDATWGLIGMDYAQEALEEAVKNLPEDGTPEMEM